MPVKSESEDSKFSINTCNESSLHNTLKVYYAQKYKGQCEVKADGHIYDILCGDGQVIEIQTKNLSKLKTKITDALEKGHKVRLVYPLVQRTRIILTSEEGEKISNRLSPKKGCIYDLFREITGLIPLLLQADFTLEVITINMIEHRVRTSEAVQTENKSRRFKKNWLKVNKRLDEILEKREFNTAEDYLALLPEGLEEEFCAKDIAALKTKEGIKLSRYAHLILWVFVRIPLIEEVGVKNRSHYYRIKKSGS